MNHPYNEDGQLKRLVEEYKKYETIYIAFDFDNTIWKHDEYKNQYEDNHDAVHWDVVNMLKKARELGMKLCLWTSCYNDEEEQLKADLCKAWGIDPDYINWSPLSPKAKKPHFNLLLDDRAGLESGYNVLRRLICMAKHINWEKEKDEKIS